MDSTTKLAKEIFRKGVDLDREKHANQKDPVKDITESSKLKHEQIQETLVPSNKDAARISPYIEQRFANQNLFVSEQRLINKRKEFVTRRQHLQSQWKELASRENMLKENFIIFSKFLKTNLEKRERALKKYQTDIENLQKRTDEVNSLRKKVEARRYEFELMRSEIKKHTIYQFFLDKVVDLAPLEFKDIEDIPKRMELLLLAKERLHASQADLLASLECSKRVMSQFMESKILQIIGLNNTVATLQGSYEEAVNRTLELDSIVVGVKMTLINCTQNLYADREAIKSLYHQTCMVHGITERHRVKGLLDQLIAVNRSMKGYEAVYGMLRRQSKRNSRLTNTVQINL